jgi:integrase
MALEYIGEKNDAWKRNCTAAIKGFLDAVYKTERANTDYEKLATRYLKDNRDWAKDVVAWRKASTMAPKTLKTYLSPVAEFLEINGVVLDKIQLKKIRKLFSEGEEAPTDAPDKGQIRSFLEHADVRMKAVALLGCSTGMRMGEILSLREGSIDFDRRMITLKAASTKTKKGRSVFFTKECEKALVAFQRVRSKYIADNNKKVAKFKGDKETTDDGRIFPYDAISINKAWNKTLKKSGQYQKNDVGFVTFHPHSLRQFFSTQLRRNGCPDSAVEVLLGHKMYLQTYTRYSPAELQELYEKHAPASLVIGSADDVQRTVNTLAEKAMETNGKVQSLEDENAKLRGEVASLHTMFAESMKIVLDYQNAMRGQKITEDVKSRILTTEEIARLPK